MALRPVAVLASAALPAVLVSLAFTGTAEGNAPPVANIVATPSYLTAGQSTTLDGSGSSDPEGGELTYAWTFGGGLGSSAAASVDLTYTVAGSYTVTLTVTDDAGATATKSKTITVSPASYDAPYAVNAPTIDGTVTAWSNIPAIRLADDSGRTPSTLDNTATVRFQWDFDYLYAAYSVTDTVLQSAVTTPDIASIYRDDAVELYVDTLNDGGTSATMQADDYQVLVNIANVVTDFQGNALVAKDITWDGANFQSAVVVSATGYTVEMAIKWSDLGVLTSPADQTMGIEIAIDDRDDNGATQAGFAWNGVSPLSRPANWRDVTFVGAPDLTPPTDPSGLQATAISKSQINLAWTASTDIGGSGVTGYKIRRGLGTGPLVEIATVGAVTTYSNTTGLAEYQQYTYKVQAVDAAGNPSQLSNAATARTLDQTPPNAPTNLAASAVSSSQINLTWTGSTDAGGGSGVTGYKIWRGLGTTGALSQIASVGLVTAYPNTTGLNPGQLYTYKVEAVDAAQLRSVKSDPAQATTSSAAAPLATLPKPPPNANGDCIYTVGGFKRAFMIAVPANLTTDNNLDWLAKSDRRLSGPVVNGKGTDGTVIIEARAYNGSWLWDYDTKIGKDRTQDNNGLHEAMQPWDMDGDGKDEVMTVKIAPGDVPYLVVLNGATGTERATIRLPLGEGGESGSGVTPKIRGIGNHYMTIAYLDGPPPAGKPSIILSQGIYKDGAAWAYDFVNGALQKRWSYQHTGRGVSGHQILAYDVNGDGKDEVIFGGTVIKPDGIKKWALQETITGKDYGHVDVMVPGDLDPDHPGIEIFYGVEIPNADSPAIMVDADTGWQLWRVDGKHMHSGWVANINRDSRGDECRVMDKPPGSPPPPPTVNGTWSAAGTRLGATWEWGLHRPVEFTGDDVYDKITSNFCCWSYGADLGGGSDHGAEEIVRTPEMCDLDDPGATCFGPWKVTVEFNCNPAPRASRWANRHYRQDVTHVGSGYGAPHATFRVVQDPP